MHVYNTNDDNKHLCCVVRKPKIGRREGGKRTKNREISMNNMRNFLMNYGLCTLERNVKSSIFALILLQGISMDSHIHPDL